MNKVVLTELEYQAAAAARIAERTRASLRSAGEGTEKAERLAAALQEWEDQAMAWTEVLHRAVLVSGVTVDPMVFVDADALQGVFFCLFPKCPENAAGAPFSDLEIREHLRTLHDVTLPDRGRPAPVVPEPECTHESWETAGEGRTCVDCGGFQSAFTTVDQYVTAYATPVGAYAFGCTQCDARDPHPHFPNERNGPQGFMAHLRRVHGIGPGSGALS